MPAIYLIRHGEKPGHGLNGLNAAGIARAEALVHVFKHGSEFKIKHIIAQKPRPSGKRGRPLETVHPLAKSLSLTVNTNREREDVKDVASDVLQYVKEDNAGDVLICWEHKRLRDIATAFGVKHAPDYDDQRFDLLWKLEHPYDVLYVTNYSIADSPGKTEWVKSG
jgi:broad specificity phosphatase PhoE